MKPLLILSAALLVFLTHPVHSQQERQGITTARKGFTDIRAVEAFERQHPPKPIPQKRPPNEEKERGRNRMPADANTAPFTGKMTTIGLTAAGAAKTQEAPCSNFPALGDNNASIPPDVNGAVGFEHLMTTLNTEVRIQTKFGIPLSTVSLLGFWNGLGGHVRVFDPKVVYDPYDRRWIMVCCASSYSANSSLMLAVSETPDPTGGWTTYNIDGDPANVEWFDYPSLGFNGKWITVGGNLFNNTDSSFSRSRIYVINKALVYAGVANMTVTFFDRVGVFTIVPAITYSATEERQWLVANVNNNASNRGIYFLYHLSGSQGAPVLTNFRSVDVGPAWADDGVAGPQLNSTTGLHLGDDRIRYAVLRNGMLWAANNVFLPAANPSACAVQVVSIYPTLGTVAENIRTAAGAAEMNAYPSVAVNRNNEVFIGFSTFRTSGYASATVCFRRNNGQGFLAYDYKAGEDWYVKTNGGTDNRWGDYTATSIDPEDDVTAWTIQQYARPRNNVGTSFWGTWWAKVCPGSCATDVHFFAFERNAMQKYEASGTISSVSSVVDGSFIKYDAGTKVVLQPGFRVQAGSRFQAYIEGCGGVR